MIYIVVIVFYLQNILWLFFLWSAFSSDYYSSLLSCRNECSPLLFAVLSLTECCRRFIALFLSAACASICYWDILSCCYADDHKRMVKLTTLLLIGIIIKSIAQFNNPSTHLCCYGHNLNCLLWMELDPFMPIQIIIQQYLKNMSR